MSFALPITIVLFVFLFFVLWRLYPAPKGSLAGVSDRIEAELTKSYRQYQKRLEIPGFRKGKVPLRLIVARYGEWLD